LTFGDYAGWYRIDVDLSILYLRCWAFVQGGAMWTLGICRLSILYLRCCFLEELVEAEVAVAFNSLFEMLNYVVQLSFHNCDKLSILYLRCRNPPAAGDVVAVCILSILYLRCEEVSFSVPWSVYIYAFNSLFEMRMCI